MNDTSPSIWHFGPFVLSEATSELTRDGRSVSIEPQSLRLLCYLIQNRDRVVSRDDLVDAIWHQRIVSDWAISGAVKAVRVALDDTAKQKQFIHTVHSRGFRFVADVTKHTAYTNRSRQKILVRLFRVLGSENELSYLADGLTEDLIAGLGTSPQLDVLSYNTACALGDARPPTDYGVTQIVEGNIRRLGDLLRINVATLDVNGETQNWAERFDLSKDSLISGHDMIRDRLIAVLTPGQGIGPSSQRGTKRALAYDHYQKGRYAYFRYEPKAFVDALSNFEAATALDPKYANAYAQQAYCRTTLYVFGLPGSDTNLEAAEALARKAIEVDTNSALGYVRLGWVLGYLDRPQETGAAFEAALQRAPDSAEVYHAYGETMNRLAQPEKALPLLEAVFSKDSYFPPSWEFPQGHSQLLLGAPDTAAVHFKSVLERVEQFIPARVQLVRALWENGDEKAAKNEVTTIKQLAPKYSLAHAQRMFPYPGGVQMSLLLGALENAGMQ